MNWRSRIAKVCRVIKWLAVTYKIRLFDELRVWLHESITSIKVQRPQQRIGTYISSISSAKPLSKYEQLTKQSANTWPKRQFTDEEVKSNA
jgi:hypothetical protein